MTYEHILYEIDEKILTITLNRPEAMNAFTQTMRDELVDALNRADEDDNVRAIIFTGAGDRAYCAGADLSKGKETFDRDTREDDPIGDLGRDGGGYVTLRFFESKKPLIGAINGAAVGIGATMLLPMDVRIAADTARFGFVFARRGIIPEACSSWFLPRLVGISQALDWVFSGRLFPASEALEGGLVKEVVPADQLMVRAREIARSYVDDVSAVSVALSRHMLWKMLGADHPMEAHKIDSRGIGYMGKNADAREGVTSFLEKRPPEFKMSPRDDMPEFYPWWEEPEFE